MTTTTDDNDNGDGAMGDKVNDDGDGAMGYDDDDDDSDDATGNGATGYDDDVYGKGRRQ